MSTSSEDVLRMIQKNDIDGLRVIVKLEDPLETLKVFGAVAIFEEVPASALCVLAEKMPILFDPVSMVRMLNWFLNKDEYPRYPKEKICQKLFDDAYYNEAEMEKGNFDAVSPEVLVLRKYIEKCNTKKLCRLVFFLARHEELIDYISDDILMPLYRRAFFAMNGKPELGAMLAEMAAYLGQRVIPKDGPGDMVDQIIKQELGCDPDEFSIEVMPDDEEGAVLIRLCPIDPEDDFFAGEDC